MSSPKIFPIKRSAKKGRRKDLPFRRAPIPVKAIARHYKP
jgi:hypothetical protein